MINCNLKLQILILSLACTTFSTFSMQVPGWNTEYIGNDVEDRRIIRRVSSDQFFDLLSINIERFNTDIEFKNFSHAKSELIIFLREIKRAINNPNGIVSYEVLKNLHSLLKNQEKILNTKLNNLTIHDFKNSCLSTFKAPFTITCLFNIILLGIIVSVKSISKITLTDLQIVLCLDCIFFIASSILCGAINNLQPEQAPNLVLLNAKKLLKSMKKLITTLSTDIQERMDLIETDSTTNVITLID